jgi:hypothetical protein
MVAGWQVHLQAASVVDDACRDGGFAGRDWDAASEKMRELTEGRKYDDRHR